MIKITTVIGARPQFIKAAVLSRLIKDNYTDIFVEKIIHTGQHYDKNMSDVFFDQMMIPKPDVDLHIGSGSHGAMTGKMLAKIEKHLIEDRPDYLLVYGDTNSTLAGALAASKLLIPVVHIEAGLRSFNMTMPEEQNRILTDHISTLLFCPTDAAVGNLKKEGIEKGVYKTGDIMLDASLFYREIAQNVSLDLPEKFILATIHRAENTDDIYKLTNIVEALSECGKNIILPLHPRTKKMIEVFGLSFNNNVRLIDPVGYYEMLKLESLCEMIVSDSGGVQKEAYFFKKPCITLRDQTEWIETVESSWNTLAGTEKKRIIELIATVKAPVDYAFLYGKGTAGVEILNTLQENNLRKY